MLDQSRPECHLPEGPRYLLRFFEKAKPKEVVATPNDSGTTGFKSRTMQHNGDQADHWLVDADSCARSGNLSDDAIDLAVAQLE